VQAISNQFGNTYSDFIPLDSQILLFSLLLAFLRYIHKCMCTLLFTAMLLKAKKKKKKKERQREMKQYKKEWNGMFLSLSVTYKKK
jgi:hypothetical protein